MFPRRLPVPTRSFFLFGPRGTGKTTWLRRALPNAHWYNLLLDSEMLRLLRQPEAFRLEIAALAPGSWVVVDEVQKLPALLNDVHDFLSAHPRRLRFALTGSSARKLKRAEVNLLAGRVITRRFFPLTIAELGKPLAVDDLLRFGMLPLVRTERAHASRIDLLEAYVDTYIAQEVRAEGLVRNLDSFARFLDVAALANGQVTNVVSIARDAAVARPTVQGYFDVLVDTLIGTWLPAWRPRAKVKEVAHPKWYFFDAGVVRTIARRLREPLDSAERGPLLESYVLHELRAHIAAAGCGGELAFWRTPAGTEVDFIWTRGRRAVGIQVKASAEWRTSFGKPLRELRACKVIGRAIGVYAGSRRLRDGDVDVMPVADFAVELAADKILA